jgi:hypothetical protein
MYGPSSLVRTWRHVVSTGCFGRNRLGELSASHASRPRVENLQRANQVKVEPFKGCFSGSSCISPADLEPFSLRACMARQKRCLFRPQNPLTHVLKHPVVTSCGRFSNSRKPK